jgi:flagella basal body P-ring formation protein FlgA
MQTFTHLAIALATALATALAPPLAPTIGGGEEPKKAAYELALKPNVLARGAFVTFGDLVEITPINVDSLALAQLRFGASPGPGFARPITRMEILQSLVAAGRAAGDFQFRGATETLLQTVVTDVSAAELTEAATTALQAVLALEQGSDVEFELAARAKAVPAPAGVRSRELRARVHGGALGQSSAVVDVDVLVDGEAFKQVPVTFKLTRYRQIVKATGAVRAGTVLGPDNLALSREKATGANTMYLTALERVQGLVAARNLANGQLLMLGDVKAPAVIHAGDAVTVVLTRGRVKLTMRAIANGDAAIGERLKLLNPQSRTLIDGIALAPGTAVIPAP